MKSVQLWQWLSIVGLLAQLTTCAPATAQVEAQGAFDSFGGCSRHTCGWSLSSDPKEFKAGDFSYSLNETTGYKFVVRRGKKVLLRTELADLSGSIRAVWSDDQRSFAITWSDGGSIGRFHVRAFRIDGDSVIELPTVAKAFHEFKSRNWCKTRGDNVQAFDWFPDSSRLVLVASVYPTGDCGPDLGHTEAYVVNATNGDIEQHWSLRQLKSYMRLHPE